MSVPSTPSKRLTLETTTTPTTSRIATTSSTLHSSPHYQTTRRHSLYGTEDRIVIDPGSRIWKVGFSGEGRPRDAFFGGDQDGLPLWGLTRATDHLDREEEDRMLQAKLQERLRAVFHECVPGSEFTILWISEARQFSPYRSEVSKGHRYRTPSLAVVHQRYDSKNTFHESAGMWGATEFETRFTSSKSRFPTFLLPQVTSFHCLLSAESPVLYLTVATWNPPSFR
jgi:hypothetical protein